MSLVEQALVVAQRYPVFPTNDKRPCWSNKELGVDRGEGGYKVATQDPDRVVELFSHRNATEIAVPMGSMSGLICVDVDSYKGTDLEAWLEENKQHLSKTMCHKTRSGGLHFFFKHPGGNIHFPATLRPGVDLKAGGTGYVCFPPTEGYRPVNRFHAKSFPMELLAEAMKAKGGTGKTGPSSSYNDATDEDLIEAIISAQDFYPALRSLSFRLPTRRHEDGSPITEDQQIEILRGIMDSSVAADEYHARHKDWEERYEKIEELVRSANKKQQTPAMSLEAAKMLAETASFIDTQKILAAGSRPIGPQRETTPTDIEERVAALESEGDFLTLDAQSLRKKKLNPIRWLVPGMLPAGGTVSLGGTSNVGKTRWLSSVAILGAAGRLGDLGLPAAAPFSTLWIANEERADDIERRIKAVVRQHELKKSLTVSVRGKGGGMLRLVAINEAGNPEIDEENVARIVAEARRIGAAFIIFDPYITLSDAMDENSATSAAVLTKAFILITMLTGCTILHAHHTPKDRSKDHDWYRGDASAWRGSGAIYSALDCGYTLSHWMPKRKEARKAWKDHYLDQDLGRWIVLDTGKIREGKPLEPILMEMVGQDMDEGEGDPIGVCRHAPDEDPTQSMTVTSLSNLGAYAMAELLIANLGPGSHHSMTKVHEIMRRHPSWYNVTRITTEKLHDLFGLIGKKVTIDDGSTIHMRKTEAKNRPTKWMIQIQAISAEVVENKEEKG